MNKHFPSEACIESRKERIFPWPINEEVNELRRRYDQGESVLSLSKRFDAPPVNTFRAILTGRGWSKNRIKESLKSPSIQDSSKGITSSFNFAEEADRVSSVNQSETQSAAEIFEEILCSHFTQLGVRYRKQGDLEVEQKKSEGRAVITPDLLLLDDVRINGIPCAWIDAKHFFGAALGFPRKKTQKQVDRYVAEYGHGAVVYRHGFCSSLRLRGAILLDASPLDLSKLEFFHERIVNQTLDNLANFTLRNSKPVSDKAASMISRFTVDIKSLRVITMLFPSRQRMQQPVHRFLLSPS